MLAEELKKITRDALEEMKAKDISELDIRGLTEIADFMFIVTGTSQRHVKSMANNVVECAKEAGVRPIGIEGEDQPDWVLVDLGDVIVHVMLEEARDYYNLERLWRIEEAPAVSEDE